MKPWKNILTYMVLFFICVICVVFSAYAADSKTVTSIDELQSEAANATEDTTLYLSNDFVSGNATLSVPAEGINVTVDGGNTLWDQGPLQVEGAGGGSLTIKNIQF